MKRLKHTVWLVVTVCSGWAQAASPERAFNLDAQLSAGGPRDVMRRPLAEAMLSQLEQRLIVGNQPSAGEVLNLSNAQVAGE